ncbi:MAG TPA: lipid-binding SYLF domain-containing protein [Candidatus Sulfotelmatobacter sp.]|nr:lipid-binding SYLF domain-containing protein [Candidatus Sulfotelmatobacter sp.]
MKTMRNIFLAASLATATVMSTAALAPAKAATAQDLNRDSEHALQLLYRHNPAARELARRARAVLIFPNIVKAGLIFGAAYGEGELKEGPKVEYYNSLTGSWGLQAGGQSYGYAVFLMSDKAVHYIHRTHGLEIGVGPTVVVVNQGVAANFSTSTLKDDAYAFIFDQQGLMLGVSLEGTKISRINVREANAR